MKPATAWARSISGSSAFCLCLAVIGYCALLLPTVMRQGISWDEQTDLDIARSYLVQPGGWLKGSSADPSQTRLPMAVVAVVYTLIRTDDLLTARWVSCCVGALTIVGVFVACRRDFDGTRGLLACAILATSPFFLSFARTAFTETDIYVACAFAWLLVAMSHLRENGTLGWATVTAVVLGLALSAKFTVIVIFPAIVMQIASFSKRRSGRDLPQRAGRNGVALLTMMCAATLFGWFSIKSLAPDWREDAVLRIHFYLALLGWLAVLVWAGRHRKHMIPPLPMVGFVILVALGTFMILPPDHITNPIIIASLFDRFQHEMGWNPGFMVEAATLHLASVLFKSSPLIGLGLLISPIAAIRQWKQRPEIGFPLLVVGLYFLGLVLLPLAQTFYMMPVMPVLAILAADQLSRLVQRHKRLAMSIGVIAAIGLSVDLALCYPDFNLNGYQWLGAQYMVGRSTIGYRSVVQTTSDGVQQVAQWLNENAQRGDRVVAYVYPWHILEATCPDRQFWLVRGEWSSVYTKPDYVVVHINHRIRQRWAAYFTGDDANAPVESVFWDPYDVNWLHAHFHKVATVRRAFGIEMASIWKSNE